MASPTIELSDCEDPGNKEENDDGDDPGHIESEEEEFPSAPEEEEIEEDEPEEEQPEEEHHAEKEPEEEEPREEPQEASSEDGSPYIMPVTQPPNQNSAQIPVNPTIDPSTGL